MIQALKLHNFKCFTDLHLELGSLTLLSGLNGMGKSSVIQSLLLLRQSFQQGFLDPIERSRWEGGVSDGKVRGLMLNGQLASLGTAADAFCEYNNDDNELRLGFYQAKGTEQSYLYNWTFLYENPDANVMTWVPRKVAVPEETLKNLVDSGMAESEARVSLENNRRVAEIGNLEHNSLFDDRFQYLQAERFGPRTSFATSDYQVRQQRQIGTQGEYAAHYLAVFGETEVTLKSLLHPQATSTRLQSQVEAWLSEISPGTRLEVTPNYGTDSVSLRY